MTRSLHASAAEKSRTWLLLEHPGPWPRYMHEMALPPALAEVIDRADARGVRVQLIRRPRARRATPPLRVYAGVTAGDDAWLEGREIDDPGELAALDLDALADERRPGFGAPIHDPVLLVCTHGRRNTGCARLGRPLATALDDDPPRGGWATHPQDAAAPGHVGDRPGSAGRVAADTAVWETTHVSGDELAANLVCLPHGLYYGRLTAEAARAAVDAYRRGEVALPHYRGRAGLPTPLQAVEHFVRHETGRTRVDDVTVESWVTENHVTEARVRAGGARLRVAVQPYAAAAPLCSGCRLSYRLLELSAETPYAELHYRGH